MNKLALFAVIAAGLVAMPAMSQSEKTDKPGKKPEAAAAAKTEKADKKDGAADKKDAKKALPFNGKVSAVDTTAKTITLKELVLNVTADTKIMKAGKPATLADIPVGETVTGKYTKDEAGKATAVAIRVGQKEDKPKTDAAPTKPAPKAEKAPAKGK